VYCPKCGQQLNDDVRFCWKCGTDVQKATAVIQGQPSIPPVFKETQSIAGVSGNSEQAYHCPMCGQSDKVEKVSAIRQRDVQQISGTTRQWVSEKDGGGYWTTVPVSGTQVTELARKLTPPAKPGYSPSCWWVALPFLLLVWAWVIVPFAPISRRMKFALGGMVLAIGFLTLIASSSQTTINQGQPSPIAIGASCIGVTLAVAAFVVYFIGLNEETASRKARIEATELPRWQKAMEKWNELFYCSRDDCVFDPQTRESSSINNMQELLYR
jgi:hypothetical protein